MFNPFSKNPLAEMQSLRDRAERLGLAYLEDQAVAGQITESMVETVARCLNIAVEDLVELIPDRRRPARHVKAMAGLRKAKLVVERRRFDREEE